MEDLKEIERMIARLEKLFEAKFGIRGKRFETGLRKAGRRLPRHMRDAGRRVADARRMAGHPRLSRQIDMDRARRDGAALIAHLEAIDTTDRRKGLALSVLASIGLNLLILGALFLFFGVWKGWL